MGVCVCAGISCELIHREMCVRVCVRAGMGCALSHSTPCLFVWVLL